MDELDFGEGLVFILIAAASIYLLIKGFVLFALQYIPAQLVYQRCLKNSNPTEHFFRFFLA